MMHPGIPSFRVRLLGALCVLSPLAVGCASAGSGQPASGPASLASSNKSTLPQTGAFATVQILVNMQTRTVTYTPVSGTGSSRAAFGGASVTIGGSTTLSAATGDPQVQALAINITNNYGVAVGTTPNGTATGLNVILNHIGVTSGAPTIPGDTVQLSNADGVITQSAAGSDLPYLSYGPIAAGGNQTRNWNFIVPAGVGAFSLTIVVEGATADETPPEAASGIGSASTQVRTFVNSLPELSSVAVDGAGDAYIAQESFISRISPAGVVTTVAGSSSFNGFLNGAGNVALFSLISGIAPSSAGNVIYVADSANNLIRRVALSPGADPTNSANWNVTTIAGGGTQRPSGPGNFVPGNLALVTQPIGVAINANGNLAVSEGLHANRVDAIDFIGGDPSQAANWQLTAIAGSPQGVAGSSNGAGTAALFNFPSSLAFDRVGNLYVVDQNNNTIRRISPVSGVVTTIAGQMGRAGRQDSTSGSSALFSSPNGCTVDSAGYLYISDGDNTIRRVNTTNVNFPVETVAGSTSAGDVDGPGNVAQFNNLTGITIDASGNIYVADFGNQAIRLVQRALP